MKSIPSAPFLLVAVIVLALGLGGWLAREDAAQAMARSGSTQVQHHGVRIEPGPTPEDAVLVLERPSVVSDQSLVSFELSIAVTDVDGTRELTRLAGAASKGTTRIELPSVREPFERRGTWRITASWEIRYADATGPFRGSFTLD